MIKTTNSLDCHYPIPIDKDIYILTVNVNPKNIHVQTNKYAFQILEDINEYDPEWIKKYLDSNDKLTDELVDTLYTHFCFIYTKDEIKDADVEIFKMDNMRRIVVE